MHFLFYCTLSHLKITPLCKSPQPAFSGIFQTGSTCTPGDRMVELYSYFNFSLSSHFWQPFTWWRLFFIYSSFLLLLNSPSTHDPDRYRCEYLQFALSIYLDKSFGAILILSTITWRWWFKLIFMLLLYIDAPFNSRYDCYVKMEIILIMNIKLPYLEIFK